MPTINRPFRHNPNRGSKGADLTRDIAHDYRRTVGAWLRDHRVDAGLTQEQVADALGVGGSAVSAFETGRGAVPPERYSQVADLLGIDHEEFAKTMLRFTNPWLYRMLLGDTLTAFERKQLDAEIKSVPPRSNRDPK